jgi:hypothetical protein
MMMVVRSHAVTMWSVEKRVADVDPAFAALRQGPTRAGMFVWAGRSFHL